MSADLSIRTVAGTLITSSTELFSGAITQGVEYTTRFRVYNNYDASVNIAHARGVEVFLTSQENGRVYDINQGDPNYHAVAKALYVDNIFSGALVSGSQSSGSVVAVSGTLQSYLVGISEVGYDYIYASGSANFNEYTLTFTYPSGTTLITSSGSLGIGVKYREIIY